jgi:hypothetical protein
MHDKKVIKMETTALSYKDIADDLQEKVDMYRQLSKEYKKKAEIRRRELKNGYRD